ncbi:MAG: 16S rRNA (cytidine(1402)-2'-O)-methyltransferase [Pseudomonadales bacterium]|nr:16S rRNA (cytidine(1402)-2'-O)-methyltransferase [Pseudomonadales bacterium]RZV52328.1 MAG: 16S rRNA (cytidine(1402)-2'-O)-methyltransferase [Pseudomonadales bacterium]
MLCHKWPNSVCRGLASAKLVLLPKRASACFLQFGTNKLSSPTSTARHFEAALYVVSTPIGNLGDITSRALALLREADVIAAEDTRHSGRLLAHFGIQTPLLAYHDHSDAAVAERILDRVEAGEVVALVSDAGTPLIADPGFRLVRAARQRSLAVVPVPGASALLAALSVAGMPTDRFVFEGFLPARAGPRQRQLEALQSEPRTLIFYEAPHRVLDSLTSMREVFGAAREAFLARELTKQFETLISGTLEELVQRVASDSNQQRGELVLVVAGARQCDSAAEDPQVAKSLRLLLPALPLKQAVAITVELSGASRNAVYELALALRDEPET